MAVIDTLSIKIFADGAVLSEMIGLARNPLIKGFTTNPTLMRQDGVTDYAAFAKDVLSGVPDHPISFEVFADEFDEMERQALEISSWGDNVYVKIPVTNTKKESAVPLIARLAGQGVKVNVTAVFTLEQTRAILGALKGSPPAVISLFAGRIADAGLDPIPMIKEAVSMAGSHPQVEILWASPREVLNVLQADQAGCHIITLTEDLLKKLPLLGKDLESFSLETVSMFYNDARAAGYEL